MFKPLASSNIIYSHISFDILNYQIKWQYTATDFNP